MLWRAKDEESGQIEKMRSYTKIMQETDKLVFIPIEKKEEVMEYMIHNLSRGYIDTIKLKVNKKNKPIFSDKKNLGLMKNFLDGHRIANNANINLYVLPLKHKKDYNRFLKNDVFGKSTKIRHNYHRFTKYHSKNQYNEALERFWEKIESGGISTYSFNITVWANVVQREAVNSKEEIHKRVLRKELGLKSHKKLH
jgi:hypothetical protein